MSSTLPPIALLAGGLATRMRPVTSTIPKSMLPVADRPFIAHQLELIVGNGIREVVICCGFLGGQIESFVGDGSDYGCKVRYSYDGHSLRGTGGAIRNALPVLPDTFFVMYGDSYLLSDYRAAFEDFRTSGKLGLMTVFRNENRWDKSNVEFVDSAIRNYDKENATPTMHYIDYGLGIFKAEAFSSWTDDDIFDLTAVYRRLVKEGQLRGFEVNERFYEIGTPSGLAETDSLLRKMRREQRVRRTDLGGIE